MTQNDKFWLCQLAALIVGAVNAIVCGQFKTQIAEDRIKDLLQFGLTGESLYLRRKL